MCAFFRPLVMRLDFNDPQIIASTLAESIHCYKLARVPQFASRIRLPRPTRFRLLYGREPLAGGIAVSFAIVLRT